MSPTTAAWLALACPLAGTIVNGLGYKVFKNKLPGVIGTPSGGLLGEIGSQMMLSDSACGSFTA